MSVLLNFECDHEPSLPEAAKALGVSQSSIDKQFGIVAIDPDQGLYTVMVDEAVVDATASFQGGRGPYSNPKIAPMRWKRGR